MQTYAKTWRKHQRLKGPTSYLERMWKRKKRKISFSDFWTLKISFCFSKAKAVEISGNSEAHRPLSFKAVECCQSFSSSSFQMRSMKRKMQIFWISCLLSEASLWQQNCSPPELGESDVYLVWEDGCTSGFTSASGFRAVFALSICGTCLCAWSGLVTRLQASHEKVAPWHHLASLGRPLLQHFCTAHSHLRFKCWSPERAGSTNSIQCCHRLSGFHHSELNDFVWSANVGRLDLSVTTPVLTWLGDLYSDTSQCERDSLTATATREVDQKRATCANMCQLWPCCIGLLLLSLKFAFRFDQWIKRLSWKWAWWATCKAQALLGQVENAPWSALWPQEDELPDSHQAALWALWALWACLTGIQQPEQQTKTIDTPLKQQEKHQVHTKSTAWKGWCLLWGVQGRFRYVLQCQEDREKILLAFGRSALLPILIS